MKYLILDFGKVLAFPKTGNWFITPKFLELVDINKIDLDRLKDNMTKYGYFKDGKLVTLEEEYVAIKNFYYYSLKGLCNNYDEISTLIARDFVYDNNKYGMYDDVVEELKRLSRKYKLIMLTDNWPCVNKVLYDWDIYKYFEKIYISSIYGTTKKDKDFFMYPIKEYNIESAIFVDDNEELLSVAQEIGLDVLLMDREQVVKNSGYKVISSLSEIN